MSFSSHPLGTPLMPDVTSQTVLEFGAYYKEEERAYALGLADKPWSIYDSQCITAYDIRKDISALPPYSIVVELFSIGGILRIVPAYKLGKGIAVSLGDGRTQTQREYDSTSNIELVEANLITVEGWNLLNNALGAGHKADLVICDPKGGVSTIPNNVDLHLLLLQKMIELLSSSGTLVINLSTALYIDGKARLYEFLSYLQGQGYIIHDMIILGGLLRVQRL